MKLLFAHGWGLDRHVWDALAPLLADWEQVRDDRGYFGEPLAPPLGGPCIAVTHSFGTMRVLADPPPGLAGIVAINGFARFTARAGSPGVPVRVVDHMLRRFEQDPRAVLASFRTSVGAVSAFPDPDPVPLRADLLRLRDGQPPLPAVPIVSVQGENDPLLPAAMRETVFDSGKVRRISLPGGHLLPLEAPDLCAQVLHGMLAQCTR